ncbi:glutathionylspermidine synthase family protein [Pseudomonas sp. LFM046]|uniref:glutathionylspermidine synthase family protein n=1 Tax=Pseudomonas sp. LFM046 TaxID=1608357 RepID=UPI0005CFDA3D|nr:glutathionylspermidine synthase family protein [Pseudomonas sp. LFM046]
MQRVHFTPRNNWQSRCEEVGFTFHSIDGRYWDESVAYQFSLEQIETLEAATEDLHQRYLETVDWVIRGGHFEPFALPSQAIELIRDSWQRREPCLYGRFDFSWNGQGQPKLLEYNADTPTGLLEASVVQWHWLNDQRPEADQFNALHEKLIARWRQIGQGTVHFAAIDGHEEDTGNALYMLDVANQAGLDVRYLPIESIGHDPFSGRFVDLDDQPIRHCFKLYPWEWLFQDEFGQHIASSGVRFQEPAWKLLMASKAMLPLLWQRYPDHPNLLPASFKDDLPGAYVRKPLYSREGENILIVDGDRRLESPGPSQGPFIYQGFAPLAEVDGNHAVLGSWVIGDQAAGLGIREDASPITRDSSRFVPHYFID